TVVRGFWGLARGSYRFDAAFIDGLLVHGAGKLTVASARLSGFFDKYFVDGLVNLIGWVLLRLSRGFRRLQTGLVSNYAMVLAAGVLMLVGVYMVLRLT